MSSALGWLSRTTTIPDVLLVDLGMPDGTGLDVIRDAVSRFPGCEPLVVSVFGDEENVLASIEAGAVGYIHKDAARSWARSARRRSTSQTKQGGSTVPRNDM